MTLAPEQLRQLALKMGWNEARKTTYQDLKAVGIAPCFSVEWFFEDAIPQPRFFHNCRTGGIIKDDGQAKARAWNPAQDKGDALELLARLNNLEKVVFTSQRQGKYVASDEWHVVSADTLHEAVTRLAMRIWQIP